MVLLATWALCVPHWSCHCVPWPTRSRECFLFFFVFFNPSAAVTVLIGSHSTRADHFFSVHIRARLCLWHAGSGPCHRHMAPLLCWAPPQLWWASHRQAALCLRGAPLAIFAQQQAFVP
jgi:hypothetical protein